MAVAGAPKIPFKDSAAMAATLTTHHPFKGRTVSIVNDLSTEEQWYLYQKARDLRRAVATGGDLGPFRLQSPEMAVYTIFMEDSTRTKESFRNAAEFHGMKVNVLDANTSALQKNETITDTIKMLCNYSTGQSLFVIRSKLEGVCTWLEDAFFEYAEKMGVPRPSFINAGDGRHEHPSQELLDEFSFLEQLGWDRSHIHVALLGDLYYGRTVHSKVDGLKLYGKVEVDLIAPAELALPLMYEERMVAAGYTVRKFASIAEYLEQSKVAKIWYFTRLQLERMGEKVLSKSLELRKAVTMHQDFLEKLPAGTKFFHPLPRDGRNPTLPFWLDKMDLNGWDRQSQNGYFTRIVLLGMLGGLFGDDFSSTTPRGRFASKESAVGNISPLEWDIPGTIKANFIEEVSPADRTTASSHLFAPLTKGIVIDGLAEGQSEEQIWGILHMIRSILKLYGVGSQGVVKSPVTGKASGFIAVPDLDATTWDRGNLKKLAAMAPGSVLKDIADGKVRKEYRFSLPQRIYNFPGVISCKNEACVSYPSNGQREVTTYFVRIGQDASWRFACKYCETPHNFLDIWDYAKLGSIVQ